MEKLVLCSSIFCEPVGAYGVDLWKNIRRGWEKFCIHPRFEMREGSKFRFWYDLWCGDMAHKDAFPLLFGIACTNDAFVAAHVELSRCAIQ
jgi:hypothetical protein